MCPVTGSTKLPKQRSALEWRSIQVKGIERTFAVARGAPPSAPLLLVFHGMGINGAVMAEWTGLARRGPAAGFATVFPEALHELWDDTGFGRTDGADDAGFIGTLIETLTADGTVRRGQTILMGLSNGATFVEHLARHGVVKALGIVLVAGTSRAVSRAAAIKPVQESARSLHSWNRRSECPLSWRAGVRIDGLDSASANASLAAPCRGPRVGGTRNHLHRLGSGQRLRTGARGGCARL